MLFMKFQTTQLWIEPLNRVKCQVAFEDTENELDLEIYEPEGIQGTEDELGQDKPSRPSGFRPTPGDNDQTITEAKEDSIGNMQSNHELPVVIQLHGTDDKFCHGA